MIENIRGNRWSILDIITAHSLDFHRARALAWILCDTAGLRTVEIRDAAHYLKLMIDNPRLIGNAVALTAAPADIKQAEQMTASAICDDFGITAGHLREAVDALITEPGAMVTFAMMTIAINDAIRHLRAYIDGQEGDTPEGATP